MAAADEMIEIISDRLGVPAASITLESSFMDELGADSLDLVELVMTLEDRFGVIIPDEDAERLRTVGDAIRYVEGLTGGIPPRPRPSAAGATLPPGPFGRTTIEPIRTPKPPDTYER